VRCSGAQLGFIDEGKAIDTRIGQKAFKSANSGFSQWLEVIGVSLGDASPRSPVYGALAVCCRTLCCQGCDCGGRRKAIQGHIHQRGEASGCGSLRPCLETFPLGAARFINVCVRVN
jgi:hypothetical protein